MTTFVEQQILKTETCCNCSMLFAVPEEFNRHRRQDHALFYCPAGHAQHYPAGNSDNDRLRKDLERERQVRESAEARAGNAEQHLAQVTRAHRKMRDRVMNGVCPCCNRSFGNLREHMRTEHAEFGNVRTMLALRQAFGMTQVAVAEEAGVKYPSLVSSYERGRPMGARAKKLLDEWLTQQDAKSIAVSA